MRSNPAAINAAPIRPSRLCRILFTQVTAFDFGANPDLSGSFANDNALVGRPLVAPVILPLVLKRRNKAPAGHLAQPRFGHGPAVLDRGGALFCGSWLRWPPLTCSAPLRRYGFSSSCPCFLLRSHLRPGLLLRGRHPEPLRQPGAVFPARLRCAIRLRCPRRHRHVSFRWPRPVGRYPKRPSPGRPARPSCISRRAHVLRGATVVGGWDRRKPSASVGLSWLSLAVVAFFWPAIHYLLGWIASPSSFSTPGISSAES